MSARHTQERADIRVVTSQALVNGVSSKVVNIASIILVKRFFGARKTRAPEGQRLYALRDKKIPGTSPGISHQRRQ